MSLVDFIAISTKKLMIDSECSLENEFIKLISMSCYIVLYVPINTVDSRHGWICGILSSDTKDIFKINDHVLIMAYESLAT